MGTAQNTILKIQCVNSHNSIIQTKHILFIISALAYPMPDIGLPEQHYDMTDPPLFAYSPAYFIEYVLIF